MATFSGGEQGVRVNTIMQRKNARVRVNNRTLANHARTRHPQGLIPKIKI